jgi:formate hydrogenlyase subunit 6/NADH:ubiquinone oxidoreductase subunit I
MLCIELCPMNALDKAAQYDRIGKRWCHWNEARVLQKKQPPVNLGHQPHSPRASTLPLQGAKSR